MNLVNAEILTKLTYQGIHHLPQPLQVHCLCYCCPAQCAVTAAGSGAVQCHCLCCPESSAVQSVSDSLLLFAAGINCKISYYHNIWLLRENYADFVANIHSVYFFWLGKFKNRDWICYLKVCINSKILQKILQSLYLQKDLTACISFISFWYLIIIWVNFSRSDFSSICSFLFSFSFRRTSVSAPRLTGPFRFMISANLFTAFPWERKK